MSRLADRWQAVEERFGRFSNQERILIAVACAGMLYVALDALLLAPTEARRKRAAQESVAKLQEGDKLTVALAELTVKQRFDPDALNRRRLEELQMQAQAVQDALREQSALMLPADQMPRLLEGLLAHHPRLELVGLKTLPPAALDLGKEPKGPGGAPARREPAAGVFRYGLQLSLKGGYLDLLEYLREVEALPGRIYWERMELAVNDFPVSTLKLTLYTLSFDRSWMTV
jgi:MSHA biogenesis protein MshJ